jgi:hypothetical protein
MSAFDPPPIHGPVRSILPSGIRGAGLAASAAEMSGVPPVGIDWVRCCPCTPILTPSSAMETTSSLLMTLSSPSAFALRASAKQVFASRRVKLVAGGW